RQINEYLRHLAQEQGLQSTRAGFQMTPRAYRLFQSKLLTQIFEQLEASRSGRHQGPVVGEGATELQQTRPYEFGDSVTHMDIPASFTNALLRSGPGLPVKMKTEDIVIHKTRNNPKCATAVLLDMSGTMRYGGLYVHVKRMGLALEGLIRKEFPGDYLQFVETYSFAKPRHASAIASLMPKPATINIFLLSSWNQSEEDVRFAYRLAEGTKGRVVFVAGSELDRYVVWDYLERKKQIIA